MMKRIFSIVLCTLMLLSALPLVSVSAEESEKVYDPFGENAAYLKTISLHCTPKQDEDGSYMNMVVKPGTYTNNQLVVYIEDPNVCLYDYPYIKMEYRTDSTSKVIDTTLQSEGKENWGKSHPECISDGEWHSFIWNVNDINLPETVVQDKTAKDIALRFKFFGAGKTRDITKETYVDIKYVALFKTEEAANAFDFTKYSAGNEPEYTIEKGLIKDGSEKLAQYNAECDALIEKIKATPTSVEVTGTKYYVSADGNDNNDGKSPATAWKSIDKVDKYKFNPGDGVFFRRGDYFRADGITLTLQSGVTYSAYGEGDKPVFVGSVDASDPNNWVETDVPNVYRFKKNISNVGSVIINGGSIWGIRITRKDDAQNVCIDNGTVYNGIDEPYHSASRPFKNGYDCLKNNLEFVSYGGMFLYSEAGNPGEVFDSIELSTGITGIDGSGFKDVTLDNIKLFGYGVHGIGVANITNFTVQNCIFGWIGGSIQSGDVRLGNAIQNWKNCDGFVIDSCYCYQIYDCCYTTQYVNTKEKEPIYIKNMELKNSVAEYANSGPEIWNGFNTDDHDLIFYENLLIHDNYTRNSGYGWSHQRPNKDGNFFYGGFHSTNPDFDNFRFYDNKFFICYKYGLLSQFISKNNVGFVDNDYIIAEGKAFASSVVNVAEGKGLRTVYPYTPEALSKLRAYGVEEGGEFYSVPADYVPEPFDWESAGDIYTGGIYDDTKNHWATDYIKEVSDAGLFKGVSANKFSPDGAMTRAMVYTVLSRFDKKEVPSGVKWYDGAVEWAIENGITTAENARPEENITRGELALMIYKYMTGKHLTVDVTHKEYTDAATFKPVDGADLETVKMALDYCASAELIMGDVSGSMRFNSATKRSEVAAVFARMYKFAENAEIDIDAAMSEGKFTVYDAEKLEKLFSLSWAGKALYEENGKKYLRLTPRTTKGTVEATLGQWALPETDFIDYQYIKIKYRIKGGEDELDITVKGSGMEQWLAYNSGVRPYNSAEDTWLSAVISYSDFTANSASTLSYATDKNRFYTIKPFGNDREIAEGSYFDIEAIAFFDNGYLAEAYEW